jgi:hypothetical protein
MMDGGWRTIGVVRSIPTPWSFPFPRPFRSRTSRQSKDNGQLESGHIKSMAQVCWLLSTTSSIYFKLFVSIQKESKRLLAVVDFDSAAGWPSYASNCSSVTLSTEYFIIVSVAADSTTGKKMECWLRLPFLTASMLLFIFRKVVAVE